MTDLTLPSDVIKATPPTDLYLSDKTWELAHDIAEAVEFEPDCPNANPRSIAAASLYIACVVNNEKRSQPLIADAFGLSVKPIRDHHPDLARILDRKGDVVAPSLENFYTTKDTETKRRGPLDAIRALIR